MPNEVKLPELGENLTQGDVLEVKIAPGDQVAQGQTLVEIEAEKSTVEVPSPVAGRVSKVLVKKGDTVGVGQTFCLIESEDGERDRTAPVRQAPSATTEPEPKAAARQAEVAEPAESAGDTAEEPGVTPMPAGAPAGEDGRHEKAVKSPSGSPDAGGKQKETPPRPSPPEEEETEEVAEAERSEAPDSGASKTSPRAPAAKASPSSAPVEEAAPAKAAPPEQVVAGGPATRRLARELGVELNQLTGTAAGGRVTQEDVKSYVRNLISRTSQRAPGLTAPPLPDFERWGPVERRPLDSIRRKTAEQMSLAWSLVPHVTQHDQADITDLEAFRRQPIPPAPFPSREGGEGVRLTVTAFALKAAAVALKQYPQFNASLDAAAGQLVLKKYFHIGVAVDTEHGLLVPVLRDVDKKGVLELAKELADLAEKARQKKLQVDDMKGGTFTITNVGGIGGTGFSPIVNYPEVAILGMSRSRMQPVIRGGQVTPRLLLPLSLSYDHRVIDGAAAARFTRRIAELLESPLLMLL
jgi:pyruvate dehydrogenase E2 component (dihydrolipoamide acetyltransferase)